MKLRRVNESIDDLLETIEYTLVSLRDDDFFVSVLASGPESIEVIIRLKYDSKTKSTSFNLFIHILKKYLNILNIMKKR